MLFAGLARREAETPGRHVDAVRLARRPSPRAARRAEQGRGPRPADAGLGHLAHSEGRRPTSGPSLTGARKLPAALARPRRSKTSHPPHVANSRSPILGVVVRP